MKCETRSAKCGSRSAGSAERRAAALLPLAQGENRSPREERAGALDRRAFAKPLRDATPPSGLRIPDFLRLSVFGFRVWPSPLLALLLVPLQGFAQKPSDLVPPPPLDRAEGERQGRALIAELLAQRPTENYTNTQLIRLRQKSGPWREVPVRFTLVCTPTNFANIYEVLPSTNGPGGTLLSIIHADGRPNEYWLTEPAGPTSTISTPGKLSGKDLMQPFAGSDFWVADLGLEFLHWPQQRVLRKDMRQSMNCNVLESINPNPAPGGYSRVLSWIAINRPEETVIVHAEAYDTRNDLLKAFDPRKVEKVNGSYQLAEMGMRNLQTGSRTRIEFDVSP